MGVLELVFVVAFVFVFFSVVRAMRGPTAMIDDLAERAALVQARMREAERKHDPPDWTCGHCERSNPARLRECDSCGAPALERD